MNDLYLICRIEMYKIASDSVREDHASILPVVCKGLNGVKEFFNNCGEKVAITSPTTAKSAEIWYGSGGMESRWYEYEAIKPEIKG